MGQSVSQQSRQRGPSLLHSFSLYSLYGKAASNPAIQSKPIELCGQATGWLIFRIKSDHYSKKQRCVYNVLLEFSQATDGERAALFKGVHTWKISALGDASQMLQ